MEITNESRGWHLHFHLLVETRWIDSPEVARTWARLVRQADPAIVCIKDARAQDYAKEVAKYVAKPAQVATWAGHEIAEAMLALKGRRSFGVFGDAVGKKEHWKRALQEVRRERQKCECGSCNIKVEPEWLAEVGR